MISSLKFFVIISVRSCLFLALLLFAPAIHGQIQGLGYLGSGSWSFGSGVSPDGNTLVGRSLSDSLLGNLQGYRWTEAGGMVGLGFLPGGDNLSFAEDASTNATYITGHAQNGAGNLIAYRWDATSGMTLLGTLPGGDRSFGKAISDDGNAIAGNGSSSNGNEAWYWSATTNTMTAIGDFPGDPFYSVSEAISGDGNTVVGYGRDANFGTKAFRWTQSDGLINMGVLPGYVASIAYAVSQDGSVIAGRCTDTTSTGQVFEAWRWTSGGGMQGLGWLPGGTTSVGSHITADGTTVFGQANGGNSGYFIWQAATGMRDLGDVWQSDYGIDLTGWNIIQLTDISADGKIFTGLASDPNGKTQAFRVKLSDIAINAPKTAERWVVGKKDSIRWNGPATSFYNIDLSLDDGANWTNLNFTTSPGDTMMTYRVPENTRTTDLARVRVSDLFDSTVFAISDKFTIKGYDLTRVMPDSSLQNYDLMKHSWQFGNASANMWPQSWWQQYDYILGDDPITLEPYPDDWPFVPMNALPWNFPAWPTFADAFTEDQCYWSIHLPAYKEYAEEYWRTSKRTWGGSCFGFAYTSILAFNYPTQFLAANPGIAQADSIHALFLNNTIRKTINREWVKQYAGEVLANDVIGKPKSPRTLLQEAKDLFLDETKDGRPLTFFRNNASSAHTVLPYRLARDASQSNIWRLYVYDNSNPNQLNRFIYIDSTANTWTDSVFNAWGTGSNRCYLELPSGDFLQTLTMGPLETLEANPMLQLYTGVENEVLITNAAGGTIGYQDSSDFNTMSEGIAIIPKTGSFSPPIGYYLPASEYAATLSEFSNTEAVFSTISGNTIYRYSRSDADFSQQDHIYAGNGLQISNDDAASKEITLTAIVTQDSSERKICASELAIVASDSLDFKLLPGDQIQLANFGAAKTYQLQMSTTSASKVDSFNHNLVSIAANSTHQVAANWDDLNQSVTIYIDLDNDGSIDDSTMVVNQPVGIDDTPQVAEIPEQFELLQNYPNPFNPVTNIGFRIPPGGRSDFGFIELAIYDVTGRLVKMLVSENRAPGVYTEQWDATNQAGEKVGSGVYFYRLKTGAFQQVRKMLLMK